MGERSQDLWALGKWICYYLRKRGIPKCAFWCCQYFICSIRFPPGWLKLCVEKTKKKRKQERVFDKKAKPKKKNFWCFWFFFWFWFVFFWLKESYSFLGTNLKQAFLLTGTTPNEKWLLRGFFSSTSTLNLGNNLTRSIFISRRAIFWPNIAKI